MQSQHYLVCFTFVLLACGGEATVPAGETSGAGASGASSGGGQVEGVDCYRCFRGFSDSTFSTLPLCDGAAREAYDALLGCACDGTCNDACAMGVKGLCGGSTVGSSCGDCLDEHCPAERAQCEAN